MKIIACLVLVILFLPSEQFGIISNLMIGNAMTLVSEVQKFSLNMNKFVFTYGKTYRSLEELTYRSVVFKTNLNMIDAHNSDKNKTYTLGITQFADLTFSQFEQLLLMPDHRFVNTSTTTNSNTKTTVNPLNAFSIINSIYPTPLQPVKSSSTITNTITSTPPVVLKSSSSTPSSSTSPNYVIDWRNKNATGVVKQQGICGSCYAFASMGAIQSMYKINNMTSMGVTGKLLGTSINATLSEQHIIDCCNIPGRCDMGCNGGYVWDVFNFVNTYGVSIESTYPYKTQMTESSPRKCNDIKGQFKNILNTSAPYTNVTRKNVTDLKQKLMKGPVAVLIDATNMPLYQATNNSSKMIPFSNCSESINNHAVLLVGIDAGQNWIIKNSWGAEWGENGYITLAPGNTCGIANYAVLPNPYK